MKFFNREKEIKEILSVIESEPQLIYFIYGPINSGKTALIKEVIKKIDLDKYIPFYIDFRMKNIVDIDDFAEVLLEVRDDIEVKTLEESIERALEIILSNIKLLKGASVFFGMPINIPISEKVFQKFLDGISKKEKKVGNIYTYIEKLLLRIRSLGKMPILVLDELQMLKDISLNGNKTLLKSFFQFLVGLTKAHHLAHVFCVSSDSLFIEYVYSATELEGRAKYILVDDFEKKEALEFLNFLEKEILKKENFLSQSEKEKVYDLVGGKPVYLVSIVNDLKTKPLKKVLSYFLQDEKAKIKMELEKFDYIKVRVKYEDQEVEIKKEDVIEIFRKFKNQDVLKKDEVKAPAYYYLVKKNILFLDPINEILKPQSRLTWHAINKALEELNWGK